MRAGRLTLAFHHRGAGLEMLHDRAQNGGLDVLPFGGICLGHGHEIGAKEHTRHLTGGKIRFASGDFCAASALGKSAVPISSTA